MKARERKDGTENVDKDVEMWWKEKQTNRGIEKESLGVGDGGELQGNEGGGSENDDEWPQIYGRRGGEVKVRLRYGEEGGKVTWCG